MLEHQQQNHQVIQHVKTYEKRLFTFDKQSKQTLNWKKINNPKKQKSNAKHNTQFRSNN